MNREKLEERWDELEAELHKINLSFPPKDKLDGWIIKDADEKWGEVLAEKKIDGKIALKGFEPVGVWKDVYDLLLRRNKILHELDKIAEKLDGPAIFTSKEL